MGKCHPLPISSSTDAVSFDAAGIFDDFRKIDRLWPSPPPEFRAPQNAVFGANSNIFVNALCSILSHAIKVTETKTQGRRGIPKGYWVSIAPGPGPTFAEVADIAAAYGRLRPGLAHFGGLSGRLFWRVGKRRKHKTKP